LTNIAYQWTRGNVTECARKRDEINERTIVNTGPPAARPLAKTAPSDNRAHSIGILVRLANREPAGRVTEAFAERLISSGDARSFRSGLRRYLQLRPGITISPGLRGWNVIEEGRRRYGDNAVRRGIIAFERRPLKWQSQK
jgi:hypothetical protein